MFWFWVLIVILAILCVILLVHVAWAIFPRKSVYEQIKKISDDAELVKHIIYTHSNFNAIYLGIGIIGILLGFMGYNVKSSFENEVVEMKKSLLARMTKDIDSVGTEIANTTTANVNNRLNDILNHVDINDLTQRAQNIVSIESKAKTDSAKFNVLMGHNHKMLSALSQQSPLYLDQLITKQMNRYVIGSRLLAKLEDVEKRLAKLESKETKK